MAVVLLIYGTTIVILKDRKINSDRCDNSAPPRRGRPPSFSRPDVLSRASDAFATFGYEGASIAQLTKAMGITAQSLYAAFGSKQDLYRAVLDDYAAGAGSPTRTILEAETDVVAAFRSAFHEMAVRYRDPARASVGCLVATATLSCGKDHQAVADDLRRRRATARTAFEQRLQRGVADGQLAPDLDVATIARFLASMVQGMDVQARDGATSEELAAMADLAIERLAGFRVGKGT